MFKGKETIMKWNRIAGCLVAGTMLWACSDGDKTTGTSEESEGIVALAGKGIKGAAQKGPLVKGSNVVLRETSADGSLEPTGREFHTTTVNDKGEFQFGDLDLECQYALLSAEGYYEREYTGDVSSCPMRLDAVSNLEKRETVNINLLTHFEFKRVLNLVKEGKTFAEAKKQAAKEVLGAFGVKIDVSSAEDLNIYNSSDGDRTLYNISRIIDEQPEWNSWHDWYNADDDIDCSKLQAYVDGFADDFADDGVLADSIMQFLAGEGYSSAKEWSNMMDVDEDDIKRKDGANPGELSIRFLKSEYDFGILLFLNYMDLELCTADLWGEYRKLDRAMVFEGELVDSGYFLCNGLYWDLTTKEHIDSLKTPIDHENGTMTDPRDGQEYKTVSFVHDGKTYEWMAEDLRYSVAPVVHSRRAMGSRPVGIYSWTEAMRLNEGYMTRFVREGLIDSLHQGICPDGWHLANRDEWDALLDYVGGVNNLLDENWRTSSYYAFGKDLIGVFYNKFDFNLVPMDKDLLELIYHTYGKNSYGMTPEPEDDMREWIESTEDDELRKALEGVFMPKQTGIFALELSIGRAVYNREEAQREGRVRCVRN